METSQDIRFTVTVIDGLDKTVIAVWYCLAGEKARARCPARGTISDLLSHIKDRGVSQTQATLFVTG